MPFGVQGLGFLTSGFRVLGLGFPFGFSGPRACKVCLGGSTVDPRKLEHGLRRISARIPYTLPYWHEDNDVPTFWLLL